MELLTYTDFQIATLQATIFTPDEELSTGKVMKELYPRWADMFDADPTVIPPLSGFPAEVPRITLRDKPEVWRSEIASARVNLFWRKKEQDQPVLSMEEFYHRAFSLFCEYQETIKCRIGRLAGVVSRIAEHNKPGLFLARHFCKERWDKSPLNRPENFELHSHKRFKLSERFQVNSWARSKTGQLTRDGKRFPIVLFEQDINTLAEGTKSSAFEPQSMEEFFGLIGREFDLILRMYYPVA